ncbi:unnamed protein product, partial [marine sediment metagenome]
MNPTLVFQIKEEKIMKKINDEITSVYNPKKV